MWQRWYILSSGPGAPANNMGWDEALLEFSLLLRQPVLRFYGWAEPAATFGYSQHLNEVAMWTQLRPLIRRPTGGGLVPHEADWTYSIVVPPQHEWYQIKAIDSYRRVHEWIQGAFAALGVSLELSPIQEKPAPGRCFIGAERFDLVRAGAKVAGASQRRNRLGLLIQGSIQPKAIVCNRSEWERAMLETGFVSHRVQWSPLIPEQRLLLRAEELAREKYSQAWHNQRR